MSASHQAKRPGLGLYDPPRRAHRKHLEAVLERDGAICGLCGEAIDLALKSVERMALTLDHRIPRALGGSDELDNLQPAHRSCNSRKGFAVKQAIQLSLGIELERRYAFRSAEYRELQRRLSLARGARPPASVKGQRWTEAQRAAFNASRRGKPWTPAQREALTALRRTAASRQKQSEGAVRGWQTRRANLAATGAKLPLPWKLT